ERDRRGVRRVGPGRLQEEIEVAEIAVTETVVLAETALGGQANRGRRLLHERPVVEVAQSAQAGQPHARRAVAPGHRNRPLDRSLGAMCGPRVPAARTSRAARTPIAVLAEPAAEVGPEQT